MRKQGFTAKFKYPLEEVRKLLEKGKEKI